MNTSMRSKKTIHGIASKLLAASLLTFGLSANAAIITYVGADNGASSSATLLNSNAAAAAFDAAAPSSSLIDFESPLPAGVSIVGGTIKNAPSCSPNLCGFNTTAGGAFFLEAFGGTITFNFANAINAFGAYFTGLQLANETVTFSDGTSQSFTIPSLSSGGAFFGFTDIGKQIVSVTYNALNDITVIDDIRFQLAEPSTNVPEPVSIALLGIGLLGVGAFRRKAGKAPRA